MSTNLLTELELQQLYEAKEEHVLKLHRRATDSYRVAGPRRKLLWAMYKEASDRFALWKEKNGFETASEEDYLEDIEPYGWGCQEYLNN